MEDKKGKSCHYQLQNLADASKRVFVKCLTPQNGLGGLILFEWTSTGTRPKFSFTSKRMKTICCTPVSGLSLSLTSAIKVVFPKTPDEQK